jgi:hypothetical protein
VANVPTLQRFSHSNIKRAFGAAPSNGGAWPLSTKWSVPRLQEVFVQDEPGRCSIHCLCTADSLHKHVLPDTLLIHCVIHLHTPSSLTISHRYCSTYCLCTAYSATLSIHYLHTPSSLTIHAPTSGWNSGCFVSVDIRRRKAAVWAHRGPQDAAEGTWHSKELARRHLSGQRGSNRSFH